MCFYLSNAKQPHVCDGIRNESMNILRAMRQFAGIFRCRMIAVAPRPVPIDPPGAHEALCANNTPVCR